MARRGRHERQDEKREHARIDEDVQPRSPEAADPWNTVEDRKLRRPRPQEVERAADRREIPPGERTTAAAKADDFEEHAPHDRLLERDGLEPPIADCGEAAHTGREAAEEDPAR